MRYLMIMLLFGLFAFTLVGCNNNSSGTNPVVLGPVQLVVMSTYIGYHYDSYGDHYGTEISGTVMANPLPSIESISVNDSVYHGYSVAMGSVNLSKWENNLNLAPAISTVRMNSSIGTLTATLPRPDTVSSISISVSDTIRIGTPVTISWTPVHCDFYVCTYYFAYFDSSREAAIGIWVDTIVTGNSVTFPGSMFYDDGYFGVTRFASVNGPVPRVGASGNLTGRGVGFYFYENWSKHISVEIPIEQGYRYSGAVLSEEDAHERFKASLPRRLGFGQTNATLPARSIGTPQIAIAIAGIQRASNRNFESYFYGSVNANPLPALLSLKINDSTFYSPSILRLNWVADQFKTFRNDTILATSSLTMQLSTSIGTISGTLARPDTIAAITCSAPDTLQPGHPITISWSGSHADFYITSFNYSSDSTAYNWYLDTMVAGNSITFSGNKFPRNGTFVFLKPIPINGPFPRVGAVGNMSGNGTGFLYYMNRTADYYKRIIVGSGTYNTERVPPPQTNQEHFLNTIQKALGYESSTALNPPD